MNKELLIRLPSSLYTRVKAACDAEYKSISALVRELLLEKLDDSLTSEELAAIDKSRKQHLSGKSVNWRKVKRG
jgi:predicted DNA-binding protein